MPREVSDAVSRGVGVKLFTPDEAESPAIAGKRNKLPRCFCGCGKAAHWPQSGKPVFHTRLCGYLMALKMVAEFTTKEAP